MGLLAHDDVTIKYSTIQNWYPGDKMEKVEFILVTKRGNCVGKNSRISWTQVETGSSITWKYPSCIFLVIILLVNSSVALINNWQQADTEPNDIWKNTRAIV